MKLDLHLTIGFPGADRHDTVEIPDEEWAEMDQAERDAYMDEWLSDWAHNYIEYWYKEVE